MKFLVRVDGKDSASEDLSAALLHEREGARGKPYTAEDDPEDDPAYNRLRGQLRKLVGQYVEDGGGGNDALTLEFDTAGTVRVVKIAEAKRLRRAADRAAAALKARFKRAAAAEAKAEAAKAKAEAAKAKALKRARPAAK